MNESTINWRHFKSLLRASFLIEVRGRSSKKPYRRIFSLALSYGISSTYLAWNLSRTFFEPAYVIISFAVCMYMTGFTVINSYSFLLLDTSEDIILQQLPISKKTIFAVRSTNLFLYIFLISIPTFIPTGIFFFVHATQPWTVFYFVIILFLASIWTTCLFLILYNGIIRFFSSSIRIFSFIQMLFILLLLFFYQTLPTFDSAAIHWQRLLTGTLPYYFPPIWFTSLLWSLQGYFVIPSQIHVLLLATLTTSAFALLLSSPWLLLPDTKKMIQDNDTVDMVTQSRFAKFMTYFRPKSFIRKAGYDLFRTMIVRDRILQMHILPVLLLPVATTLYGFLTHQLDSPLQGEILTPSGIMHITIVMFFLFASRHTIVTISHSRYSQARWIFFMNSSNQLEHYAKGIYRGVMTNLLLPLVSILFVIFTYAMPVEDALLHSAFLYISAHFQIATWSVMQKALPFTQVEDRLTATHTLVQLIFVVPYFSVLMAFYHLAASASYPAFISFLVILELAAILYMKYLRRKTYSVILE